MLLDSLKHKKEVNIIKKSKIDWEQDKKLVGDTLELEKHAKSSNAELGKIEFLQQTDLKRFEIEKSLREKERSLLEHEQRKLKAKK